MPSTACPQRRKPHSSELGREMVEFAVAEFLPLCGRKKLEGGGGANLKNNLGADILKVSLTNAKTHYSLQNKTGKNGALRD